MIGDYAPYDCSVSLRVVKEFKKSPDLLADIIISEFKGKNQTKTFDRATYELDISKVSDTAYVSLYKNHASNSGWVHYYIYNFYLE